MRNAKRYERQKYLWPFISYACLSIGLLGIIISGASSLHLAPLGYILWGLAFVAWIRGLRIAPWLLMLGSILIVLGIALVTADSLNGSDLIVFVLSLCQITVIATSLVVARR